MGEAKRRGSREQRVIEGIEKDRIKHEQWLEQRRQRKLNMPRRDPSTVALVTSCLAMTAGALFTTPPIKNKRWKDV
jgi:hypothetical protein